MTVAGKKLLKYGPKLYRLIFPSEKRKKQQKIFFKVKMRKNGKSKQSEDF